MECKLDDGEMQELWRASWDSCKAMREAVALVRDGGGSGKVEGEEDGVSENK